MNPTAKRSWPLPVMVLSGFLGVGRTTLLNHLLHPRDGRRVAFIVKHMSDATYTVEGSTDLRAWEPIRQVTAGQTPQAVPLSLPAQSPPRFFRAVAP